MWRPTYKYDYLMHHGILGMQWGVQNGPPYPLGSDDHSAKEKKAGWRKSLSDYKDYRKLVKKSNNEIGYIRRYPIRKEFRDVYKEFEDLYNAGLINNLRWSEIQNLNKWGKRQDTNILFISGMSGSGKSEISKILAKHNNAEVIHLDSYFDNPKGPHNKDFDKYLNSKKSDYKKIQLPKSKIDIKDWGKVVERFEKNLDSYGKNAYKKNKKVVVEGVQILDDTMFPDKKYFQDKPVIMLRGSILGNTKRANRRDNKKFEVNDIKNRVAWKKNIRQFERQNKLSNAY